MITNSTDVRIDELGVFRVAETQVMLDSVVAAYQLGHSAETIQQQYPSLSLGDVYAAIAYYLRHQKEVELYLAHQSDLWANERREWNSRSGALVQRLRDIQNPKVTGNP